MRTWSEQGYTIEIDGNFFRVLDGFGVVNVSINHYYPHYRSGQYLLFIGKEGWIRSNRTMTNKYCKQFIKEYVDKDFNMHYYWKLPRKLK